jgi:ABC-type branched-subunit amino acid transport system permease subunit
MRRYMFTLMIVFVMALVAKNLGRGATGRAWMAALTWM